MKSLYIAFGIRNIEPLKGAEPLRGSLLLSQSDLLLGFASSADTNVVA
jgi:hypothetical protein